LNDKSVTGLAGLVPAHLFYRDRIFLSSHLLSLPLYCLSWCSFWNFIFCWCICENLYFTR